jgi:hypothetical protein
MKIELMKRYIIWLNLTAERRYMYELCEVGLQRPSIQMWRQEVWYTNRGSAWSWESHFRIPSKIARAPANSNSVSVSSHNASMTAAPSC